MKQPPAASPSFPAAKVRGIALNCARLSPAEIDAACGEVEAETGLVCVDVVHHGAARCWMPSLVSERTLKFVAENISMRFKAAPAEWLRLNTVPLV